MLRKELIEALEKEVLNKTKYIMDLKEELAESDVTSFEDEFAIGAFLLEQQLILHTLEEEMFHLKNHRHLRNDVPICDEASEVVEYIINNTYVPKIIKDGLVNDGHDLKRLLKTITEIDEALINAITNMLCCLRNYNIETQIMQENFWRIWNMMNDHLVMLELIHIYKKMMKYEKDNVMSHCIE